MSARGTVDEHIAADEAEMMETPSTGQLFEWMADGGCEATDGCWVEPDGECEHGCQSWLLVLGLI